MKGPYSMKKWLIILLITVFILLCVIGYSMYKDYRVGSVHEREELLIATTYDLFQKKNLDMKEIQQIHVTRLDAGVYPFFYSVTVELINGESYGYRWKNKNKDSLEITHHK